GHAQRAGGQKHPGRRECRRNADRRARVRTAEARPGRGAAARQTDLCRQLLRESDRISLSAARRQKVVEIARRWSRQQRIFVLEDAAYRELRYDGPELPSVWSFDVDRQTVILAQTFSKSFSPGLRVGFGVVPRVLVPPLCDRKGNEDFGSANFNQHLLA